MNTTTRPVSPGRPWIRGAARLRRYLPRPGSLLLAGSLGVLAMVVIAALLAPVLAPDDPNGVDLARRLVPPIWYEDGAGPYLLGTDGLGRDVLSRVIYGARMTLSVALAVVVFSGALGVLLGILAGYFGGWADALISRLVDAQLAFPNLLLAIAIVAALGSSLRNIILALTVAGWVPYARVVRAETLGLRNREFILACRVVGLRPRALLARHVLPNVLPVAIVMSSFGVVTAILAESSLSFLGMGVGPETPTWGGILSDGREYLRTGWWVMTFPGLAIAVTLLAVNLVGDWLRDRLDPTVAD